MSEQEETEPTIESETTLVLPLTRERVDAMLYELTLHFGCVVMPISLFEKGACFCGACFCKKRMR